MTSSNQLNESEFLLQRLQELKAWQAEQEERLLREQEEQVDQLYLATNFRNPLPDGVVEECDDGASTIDNDISRFENVYYITL